MNIELDEKDILFIDLEKTCQHIRAAYDLHKDDNNIVDLGEGKKLDLSKGSATRIVFKGIITPVIVPMLDFLFRALGSELPKYKRGDDLFDYVVHNMLYLIGTKGDKVTLYVYTENDLDSRKNIKSIFTTKRREATAALPAPGSAENSI